MNNMLKIGVTETEELDKAALNLISNSEKAYHFVLDLADQTDNEIGQVSLESVETFKELIERTLDIDNYYAGELLYMLEIAMESTSTNLLDNIIDVDITDVQVESQSGQLVKIFSNITTYNSFIINHSIDWDNWFVYINTRDNGVITPNQLSGNEPLDLV